MNWYKGNIAEAVAESKAKNAIFVVYVEGTDESTTKLTNFLNDANIRKKLESDQFVAIKIKSDSQGYMQFASIYQMVPVPSIFFIGKSGTPLDIGTGVIATVDELNEKIDKVLTTSDEDATASKSSKTLIDAEQSAAAADNKAATAAAKEKPSSSGVASAVAAAAAESIPKETPEVASVNEPEQAEASTSKTAANDNPYAEERIRQNRKILEQKRRERLEEEERVAREQELLRRKEMKDAPKMQQWQNEQEVKELKANRRRERMEEQAIRERIRAQIAGDRAERAFKAEKKASDAGATAAAANTKPTSTTEAATAAAAAATSSDKSSAGNIVRLQFRFSNGDSQTHNFTSEDTLSMVRTFVQNDLLPGTGIKEFILVTTYPRRELTVDIDQETLAELSLVPSGVILVIGKESGIHSPAAIIARSGGIINILYMMATYMMSPFYAVFGYFKNYNRKGVAKRGHDEPTTTNDANKRRNLDRFGGATSNASGSTVGGGPAPSGGSARGGTGTKDDTDEPSQAYRRFGGPNIHRLNDNRSDSDDDNATWNGNSTQQQ